MEANRLAAEYEIDLVWLPFELRPGTGPEGAPLPPYVRGYMADPDNPLKVRARAAGLPLHEHDRIAGSRLALEAAEYARHMGRHAPFHAQLFRAYFGEGKDLARWEVLEQAALSAGLDAADLRRRVAGGEFREVLQRQLEEAVDLGIRAVPTWVFDQRMAVSGAQPYPVLQEVMRRLGVPRRQGAGAVDGAGKEE